MAKRSAADLAVIAMPVPAVDRTPPRDLDGEERDAWIEIVDTLPSAALDAAGRQVLRRIATLTVTCLRIEAELRTRRASGACCADCDALIARHASVSATLGGLLARMRCTPSARMRNRQVDSDKLPLPGGRPWDRAP